jgi:hypothetical protein
MRTIKHLIIVLIAMLSLISCLKIEKLPAIPHIEFTSFTVFDTLDILGNKSKAGKLNFYFEDGDGDLGLEAPTENQTDTTNLFLTLYRKTGGTMVPAPALDPLLPYSSYRIPYMEVLGQNKILKGNIVISFLYQFYSVGDTIKYDFYITDRNSNESNVASTSEIIISENKVYNK